MHLTSDIFTHNITNKKLCYLFIEYIFDFQTFLKQHFGSVYNFQITVLWNHWCINLCAYFTNKRVVMYILTLDFQRFSKQDFCLRVLFYGSCFIACINMCLYILAWHMCGDAINTS